MPRRTQSPDRRVHPRYKCDRDVACWRRGAKAPVWGKLRDLSRQGCFMETSRAFELGTKVTLTLLLFGLKVRSQAVVRSSSSRGMGLELVAINRQDSAKFDRVLHKLSAAEQADLAARRAARQQDLVHVLEQWFSTRETLSRQEFHRLMDVLLMDISLMDTLKNSTVDIKFR